MRARKVQTKHKHKFQPGYDFCQCGARRCDWGGHGTKEGGSRCKRVAWRSQKFCRVHLGKIIQANEMTGSFPPGSKFTVISSERLKEKAA